MGDPDDLTELAEAIEQGRDAIVVPDAMVEERPPQRLVARSLLAELQAMPVGERLKLAIKGNRDARTLLLRDANRIVQRFVLSNPRITDEEVLAIAKNRSVEREILEIVCRNKEWTSNYQVRLALATNPKTPLGVAVRFVPTLLPRDLRILAKSKNVPAAICSLAKRLVFERGG